MSLARPVSQAGFATCLETGFARIVFDLSGCTDRGVMAGLGDLVRPKTVDRPPVFSSGRMGRLTWQWEHRIASPPEGVERGCVYKSVPLPLAMLKNVMKYAEAKPDGMRYTIERL